VRQTPLAAWTTCCSDIIVNLAIVTGLAASDHVESADEASGENQARDGPWNIAQLQVPSATDQQDLRFFEGLHSGGVRKGDTGKIDHNLVRVGSPYEGEQLSSELGGGAEI